MAIEQVLAVLGWSMVVNFSLLAIWGLAMMLAPDLTLRAQNLVFTISREDFDLIMYKLLGQYKIALILTHLGPYIALRIVFT